MKKVFAILPALLLLLCLCACGKKAETALFWTDTVVPAELRGTLENQLTASDIPYQSYTVDPGDYLDQVQTILGSGVDSLALCEPPADIVPAILDAAGEIPVVIFGADAEGYDLSQAPETVCFIGFDSITGGKILGELAGQFVLDHYTSIDTNADTVITYAMLRGDETSWDTAYRVKCSVDAADLLLTTQRKPALSYYDPTTPYHYESNLNGHTPYDFGFSVTARMIEQGDLPELLLCTDDAIALGAQAALDAAGLYIPVFGYGGSVEAQNQLSGTVVLDADSLSYAVASVLQAGSRGMSDVLDDLSGTAPFQALLGRMLYIRHGYPLYE